MYRLVKKAIRHNTIEADTSQATRIELVVLCWCAAVPFYLCFRVDLDIPSMLDLVALLYSPFDIPVPVGVMGYHLFDPAGNQYLLILLVVASCL